MEARTNMLRQEYVRTLKQTHQTASTVMPLVTAGLALMSALIAAQERRTANVVPTAEPQVNPLDLPRVVRITTPRADVRTTQPIAMATQEPIATPVSARAPRVSAFSITFSIIGSVICYLVTLVGTLLKVVLGAAAVIALVALYVHLERSNRTALLTVLIVSVLFLTARIARSRQRRSAGR
jgi:hypothetical protein